MQNFLFEIWLGSITFFVALCLFFLHQERKARLALASKYQAMKLLHKNSRKQYEILAKQFNELRLGSIGMGKKVVELSCFFDELAEKQNQIEMCDSEGRLYSRANKMAELGADVNELMEECELPKAEAELLLNLKKRATAR